MNRVKPEEKYNIFNIYLWEEHESLFNVFCILKDYLSDYSLDTYLMVQLIKDAQLPITESVELLPYFLQGYLSITTFSGEQNVE